MAGIYGYLDHSGTSDVPAIIDRLSKTARCSLDLQSATHAFKNGGIGNACTITFSRTQWPLVSSDGRYAMSVFGEVILPNGEILSEKNFERSFLAQFLASPVKLISKLEGAFNFALLSEEECIIVNDPSGNFALHYSVNCSAFAFSTQMMALRNLSPESGWDEQGLFEHLGISQSLLGRTLLKSVKRLNRGTMLRFSRDGLQSEEYISRDFHPSDDVESELEAVYDALSKSVARDCSNGNVTASLSGGFDSRMTWSMILSQGLREKVIANTHGLEESRDLAVSDKIAKSLGIKRDRLVFNDNVLSQFPKLWREFVTMTEGLYPLSQVHVHYVLKHLTSNGFDVVIDSYGGALYRRQIKKHIEPRIDPAKSIAEQVLPYELTPLISSSLLKKDVRERITNASLEGLRDYYSTIESVENIGDKFDMFYFDETVALRDCISANLQMNFMMVRQPLLSHEALCHVRRIPSHIRRREGIHKYIIHRAFPKLEDFSLDYSGYIAPYRGFSKLRLLGPGTDWVLRLAAKSVPKLHGISLRRPPMDAMSVLKPGLLQAKELLFSPHSDFDPFVDRAALERTLNEIESGDYRQAQAVIQLLTFRMMLEIFC